MGFYLLMKNKNENSRKFTMVSTVDYVGLKGIICKNILLLFLVIAVFVIPVGCSGSSAKKKQIRQEMSEYLKNTYETEFEIVKLTMIYHPIYGYYTYEAKAHPKGHPEFEFDLWAQNFDYKNSTDSYKGSYLDNYLSSKWSYQGKQLLEKKIREVYGDDAIIQKYEYSCCNKKFNDLNHSDVITMCGGKAIVTIIYFVNATINFDKTIEAEKAYKIIKAFVLDNKIASYYIRAFYFTKEFKEEYLSKGNMRLKDFDELNKEKKLINLLDIFCMKNNCSEKINNIDDIINCFEF